MRYLPPMIANVRLRQLTLQGNRRFPWRCRLPRQLRFLSESGASAPEPPNHHVDDSPERRRVFLWLPLFLVWPLLFILALPLLALLLPACLVLLWTRAGRRWLKLVPAVWEALCALRGLNVQIKQPNEEVVIQII